MNVDWVPLHVHSTFSVLDGYGTPAQIVERAQEVGLKAIGLTDHGSVSGHPQFEQACKKAGIKPIYGCEFYLTEEGRTRKKFHITVLARNLEGYRNILRLVSKSHDSEHFYYQPTIHVNDLLEMSEGLVVLSGCLSGMAAQAVLDGDAGMAQAEETLLRLASGIEHFYVEIQPLNLEESKKVNHGLIMLASKLGLPLVATNDVHYLRPGDERIQWFLGAVRRNKNIYDEYKPMVEQCYLCSGVEMITWGAPIESVEESARIAAMCEEFDLPKARPVKVGLSEEEAYEALLERCRKGWVDRGMKHKAQDLYLHRLHYELKLIKEKQFVDYFLIVADMVDWAKGQGILVGPARGSAAGSLVAYLMGITEVDPIEWDLLFERFIDVSRLDPPDIDLDFQHDRRDEVKAYLERRWGSDKVANIAGYSMFKARSLLDDIGRVYRLRKAQVEQMKEAVDSGTELKEAIEMVLPGKGYLSAVEGMIRQFTVHAAGMVVAADPIDTVAGFGRDGTLMLDYRDAEYLGLMKIDVLSLKTLTILKHCLDAIGKDWRWLYSVPLDDPEVYKAFSDGLCEGVFQFEGATTKRICQRLKPTNFKELIDINALSRPGPLRSGATEAYITGKKVEGMCAVERAQTTRSRGQILFQEQIMRILREAGGLSWADVTAVRKLITKKQGQDKLEGIKQRFIEGYVKKGWCKEGGEAAVREAEGVWHRCGESGAYGFNISHSTSYTFISYWCMYLKVHYGLEFYWANLMVEPDKKTLLHEFVQRGGQVSGVKLGRSRSGWSIDTMADGRPGLRAGYLTIKGIGPKMAERLEREGEKAKLTKRVRAALEEAGAFEERGDYLGFERLKRLEMGRRDRIADIKPGDFVRIAGIVVKHRIVDLAKILEERGEHLEEEPEAREYLVMVLADDSGSVTVAVNRFMFNNGVLRRELDGCDGKIVVVSGEFNERAGKVYATRVKVVE